MTRQIPEYNDMVFTFEFEVLGRVQDRILVVTWATFLGYCWGVDLSSLKTINLA